MPSGGRGSLYRRLGAGPGTTAVYQHQGVGSVRPRRDQEVLRFFNQWMQDGTAGYYGLARLNTSDFAVLREGKYQRGDRYIYAILGTGMNVGCSVSREDGHHLFVPKSDENRNFQ